MAALTHSQKTAVGDNGSDQCAWRGLCQKSQRLTSTSPRAAGVPSVAQRLTPPVYGPKRWRYSSEMIKALTISAST